MLLQCSSAGDAAAGLAAVQAAAEAAAAPLSVAQPGQFAVALRLALDQLDGAAPSDAVFVSVSDSSSWASQAAELGCATEHLPARSATPGQLQAWALQAVACHAGAQQAQQALVVGYVMKESRQLALSQQGMLPLLPPAAAPPPAGTPPAAPGMCFVPLDLGSSLQHQLQRCQLVLQKLTDCLQPGGGSGAVAALTAEATALLACLDQQQAQHAQQQALCLVDPIAALRPIMDRALLAEHLEAAALAVRQQAIPMRAPASVLLRGFDSGTTPRQLAAAGVALPCIVKPQAACGIAEAHQMAFVLHRCASSQLVGLWLASQPACLTVLPGWPSCFRYAPHGTGAWLIPPHPLAPPAARPCACSTGFADLEVPLPAVAQEYVDHGGSLWKVYVAGQQVFWALRRSTPDLGSLVALLAADPEADIPSSIGFDSLKSLPTSLPWLRRAGGNIAAAAGAGAGTMAAEGAAAGPPPGHELMRRSTFEAVAAALRQRLGLTLFGFDIVFDSSAGVWRVLGCVFAKCVSPAGLLLAACASTSSVCCWGRAAGERPTAEPHPSSWCCRPRLPPPCCRGAGDS